MLNTLKIDSSLIKYTAVKVTCICIRTSYYIFCMRDKDWSSPELMECYGMLWNGMLWNDVAPRLHGERSCFHSLSEEQGLLLVMG